MISPTPRRRQLARWQGSLAPQPGVPFVQLAREGDIRFLEWPYLHSGSLHEGERGVERFEPADRQVSMRHLLQDFYRSAEGNLAPVGGGQRIPGRGPEADAGIRPHT